MKYRFEHRWIPRLCLLTLGTLLIFSVVFYGERTLFADISFQSFHLLRTETPTAQVYRFGAVLIHLPPLLAIKLSLSLKWVLLAYSLAYPLFFLVVYFLITRLLANDRLGLTLVILLCFTTHDSFYWPVSELWQGLAALLLLFAFILRYPALDRPWQKTTLILAAPLVLFYHPLVVVPFAFCWLYMGLQEPALRHRRYFLILLLMLFSLLAKSLFFSNWYDDAKQAEFFSNLYNFFPNYFQAPSYRKFLLNSVKLYYLFPLSLLAVSGYYLLHRSWVKLSLLLSFCAGHIFLVHLGSPRALYRFYVEVSYIPLMLYTGLPLCMEIIPGLLLRRDKSNLMVGALAFLLASRLLIIWWAHEPFSQRLLWLDRQLEAMHKDSTRRIILTPDQVPMDTLMMSWGVAYESLLRSAMVHPDSARTIWITHDPGKGAAYLSRDDYFLGDFTQIPIKDLPARYFHLPKGQYKKAIPR